MEICVIYHDKRVWIELPTTIEEIAEDFKDEGEIVEEDFANEFIIQDVSDDFELDYPLGYYDLDDLNEMAEAELD